MISQVLTRRRWMLRAHGQHIVVVRGVNERFEHPLMKALIWALYVPDYPGLTIEVRAQDRYKPDVVAFGAEDDPRRSGQPLFWGEAGRVGRDKIEALLKRYADTHFVFAKWDSRIEPVEGIIKAALARSKRSAPVDVIRFPPECVEAVDADGEIHISHADVIWRRYEP